jgi:hypothetical protein
LAPDDLTVDSQVCSMNWNRPEAEEVRACAEGLNRALAPGGLHQEVEVHAGRRRGAPNGRLHAAR